MRHTTGTVLALHQPWPLAQLLDVARVCERFNQSVCQHSVQFRVLTDRSHGLGMEMGDDLSQCHHLIGLKSLCKEKRNGNHSHVNKGTVFYLLSIIVFNASDIKNSCAEPSNNSYNFAAFAIEFSKRFLFSLSCSHFLRFFCVHLEFIVQSKYVKID